MSTLGRRICPQAGSATDSQRPMPTRGQRGRRAWRWSRGEGDAVAAEVNLGYDIPARAV